MLSKVQIEHFDMFGYVALPGFCDAADLALIDDEYECGLGLTEAVYAEPIGVRGQRNWSTMQQDMPFLSVALESPKLLSAAESLLGADVLVSEVRRDKRPDR